MFLQLWILSFQCHSHQPTTTAPVARTLAPAVVTATDDANNFVTSRLIMPTLGFNFGLQINKELDIIFSLDHILGNNQSNWTYNENTGKKDNDGNDHAVVCHQSPDLDIKFQL